MTTSPQHNRRVNQTDAQMVRNVIDEIMGTPTPSSALKRVMSDGMSPLATPFERYAGMALREAGADEIVQMAHGRSLQLSPPGDGNLARLALAGAPDAQELALLKSVEGTINRLCCIADAVQDSGEGDEVRANRMPTLSLLGGGLLPEHPGYRSALLTLPPIGRSEHPDVAYFNEVDWISLDSVPLVSRNVFQRSLLPNMHQAFMGAYAPTGSDWDVRTRLTSTLGKLELPLPFEYVFDCDIPRASAAVRFTIPPDGSFPRQAASRAGKLVPVGARGADARLVYALRVAVLVAASCFGAGRNIERAYVSATSFGGEHAFHLLFNRHDFVHKTLRAIDDGSLCSPERRFEPAEVLRLAAPERALLDGDSLDDGALFSSSVRIDAHEDERALPRELETLFHARKVSDIDTRHRGAEAAGTIEAARLDSEESVLAAIAGLEHVARESELMAVPPDDDASARPLFCANPLERAVVSLLDDEQSVSMQAEAYLAIGEDVDVSPDELPHYFRAPDDLFNAHLGLADLYARMGDYRGAESEADKCLALAPVTAQAYYQKADVLAQQHRYAEAVNTLKAGLACAVSERDCALLYYHLALLLWKLDRKRDSVAIYVYTMSLSGEYAEKAARVVRSLRKRRDMPVIAFASPLAASREMARARIPLAPSDEARTLIVRAAIGLSCADAPLAAAPYAAALKRYFRGDSVISATALSIQHGIEA